MALTVGELNGILSIDDRAVDPALRRAEEAMRASGRRMGSDADRAGQQAGQQLGDGFVRGADGQWRNMQAQLVDAVTAAALDAEAPARRGGQRAGAALGEGLADGAADGADAAVDQAEGGLSRLQAVALGVGAAAGAVLMNAFGQVLEQGQITAKLGATLGKTPAEAQRYGQIAGGLYADAITADFQEAADTIGSVMGSGLVPADATNSQIESISTKVADLANTFDQDLSGVVNAATQLIRTGLAKNSTEALDLIAAGFGTSANKADDFLDTLNEYSVQFKRVGLDGQTSIGLINQAIGAGARDSDQVADAIGQFGELALGQSKGVKDAFKSIGVDSDVIAAKLKKGGKSGQEALQMTTDALRGTKDETTRLNAATALFGDPGTVMGDALLALDPAGAAASSGMNKASGAADKLGNSVRDNAATQVEQFKRRAMQGLVDFLGTKAIPALTKAFNFVQEHSTAFKIAAGVITGVLVPALALMAVTATVKAGIVVGAWITSGAASVRAAATHVGSALTTAGAWSMMALRAVGSFVAVAASATLNALRTAAAWVATGARMTATFLVAVLRVAAVAIAQFAMMAARAIAWAAVMAAQWLIAMGPVGWVIAVVIGLVALIIANWSTIQKWTGRVWDWVWKKIMSAVGLVLGAVKFLGRLPGMVSGYFGRMKDAAVRKALELVLWVKGLPGRISSGLGSLSDLLVSKGMDVVRGLWSGIQSMGGWIKDKLYSWAKSSIPGPIAKALGINSPSKVTKAQGRWIARGLIDGLTGSTKQVKAASGKLADIIADSLKPGKKRSAALAKLGSGTKQLLALAKREETLAARLKTSTKRLDDLRKARQTLAADVAKGVLDSANITGQDTGGWPQTAESILAGLRADTVAAQAFAKNLAVLRKKGVRADLISQIASAGVEGGSSAAAALANANSSQIKQINSQQGALVRAANQAGATAGDAMYGAGIHAAQGLVKGLQSQQKAIERQMLAIARGMSKAIRAALGIKSPSRVMALVGQHTAQGLIKGVEGERSAVNRSMASLVETPTAGSWDMAPAGARGSAVNRTVVEFRSSDRGESSYLMGKLRRGVQKTTGGDVEFAFSGRR
ncbi:phage tail tape measure protein [Streptomyces turgidiscabies]|uniref:phage tail tape measure protein n=1 Tax=Streptomyces turgidiscabies TaxID=85558 RepID=UPI0038F620F7